MISPPVNSGARPRGASTEVEAAAGVQSMFDQIAPHYDLLNHLLSGGVDRLWWARAARSARSILHRPEAVIVDLCCGTGDMTLALHRHRSTAPGTVPMLAMDFSHGMLLRGTRKFTRRDIVAIEADALHLPLADNSVDLITTAFGFRNLSSYADGLAEFHRVLRPSGRLAILECNQPGGFVGVLYDLYFKHLLPKIGGLFSSGSAYRYLPESVARFPRPPAMLRLLEEAGFQDRSWIGYSLGIAGLYQATKGVQASRVPRQPVPSLA